MPAKSTKDPRPGTNDERQAVFLLLFLPKENASARTPATDRQSKQSMRSREYVQKQDKSLPKKESDHGENNLNKKQPEQKKKENRYKFSVTLSFDQETQDILL